MEKTNEYNLYITSKTKIQMIEATLEEIYTKKFYDLGEECLTEIQFGTRIEINDERTTFAYLKTEVRVSNRGVQEPGIVTEIIYKGKFETSEQLDKFQFENWVDVQIVPQLLPYARVMISNLTNSMGVPPVNLPTIDVLETIKINNPPEIENGEDNVE